MSTQTDTHTPGPWAIEEGDRETHIVGGEAILAYCPDWPCAPQEQEANARLIAAAPDLLEALEKIVAVADSTPFNPVGFVIGHIVNDARAAITKARGK